MTHNEYIRHIESFHEKLRNDPVKLKAFMRSVMGTPHKTLEGVEKEHTLTLLRLTEPFKQTNNQQSWTDYYMIGETEYHVTYFPGSDDPIIDKMLPETD